MTSHSHSSTSIPGQFLQGVGIRVSIGRILKAREYESTTWHLERAREWISVRYRTWSMMELQWPSLQVPFRNVEQCGALVAVELLLPAMNSEKTVLNRND
jgi:hypothetical protein